MWNVKWLIGCVLAFNLSISLAKSSLEQRQVQQTVDMMEACIHFAGEVSGDGSERDRFVMRQQDKFCAKGARLGRAAFKRYPNNEKLFESLIGYHQMGLIKLSQQDQTRLCATLLRRGENICSTP